MDSEQIFVGISEFSGVVGIEYNQMEVGSGMVLIKDLKNVGLRQEFCRMLDKVFFEEE